MEALDLKEGDDIKISVGADRKFEVSRDRTREEARRHLQAMNLRLPPGYTFECSGKCSGAYEDQALNEFVAVVRRRSGWD